MVLRYTTWLQDSKITSGAAVIWIEPGACIALRGYDTAGFVMFNSQRLCQTQWTTSGYTKGLGFKI